MLDEATSALDNINENVIMDAIKMLSTKKTIIIDPFTTRNHTELMLKYMGVDISQNNSRITIIPSQPKPNNIIVPGDISSATYWIIAACCHPNATIKINNVGILLIPYSTGISELSSTFILPTTALSSNSV